MPARRSVRSAGRRSAMPATGAVAQTGNFQVGDTPLDGIVMAHNLDQSTINFTPEAELTDKGFFDNDNQ